MTRLGLHVNSTHEFARVVEWYRRTRAPWAIILFPDRDLVSAIKAASPKTRVVGRVVEDGMTFGNYGAFQDRTLSAARNAPDVDVWVGWNEPAPEGDDMRRLADLEIGLAKRLLDMGKGAAIGGFSTGFLEAREGQRSVEHWRRAIEFIAANPGRVWQHSHEYGGPYMQMGAITPDGRNQFPQGGSFTGVTTDKALYWNPTLRGWLVLRYRMLSEVIAGWGYEVPWLITECGIDNTPPRPGPPGNGFRNFMGTEWERYPAVGDYADQLYWAGWQYGHDGTPGRKGIRIDGVLVFCAGSENDRWLPFDLAKEPALWDKALTLQERLPVGPAGDAPQEEPMTKLVDVSQHQGVIDWQHMKAAGVQGVWIRAGGGLGRPDYKGEHDIAFDRNVEGAESVGLPWGPYWWCANGLHHGSQSIAFGLNVGDRMFQLPPALDWELNDAPLVEEAMRAEFEMCTEKLGRPLCYTSQGWLDKWQARYPWLAWYPLWLARYTSASDVPTPAPWSKWTVWQYSAGGNKLGARYGVSSTDIDINRTPLTVAELKGLHMPADDFNADGLIRAARREHEESGIHVNPTAALTKAMARDGRVPVTNEAEYGDERVPFQVGESLTVAGAMVYWWRGGQVHKAAL